MSILHLPILSSNHLAALVLFRLVHSQECIEQFFSFHVASLLFLLEYDLFFYTIGAVIQETAYVPGLLCSFVPPINQFFIVYIK